MTVPVRPEQHVHPDDAQFGRYESMAKLATGGMADVFLARLSVGGRFDKLVAIKAMHPALATRDEFVRMFEDEARVVARMSHPNICQTHELGTQGNRPFIAMEWLRGVSMARYMRRVDRTDDGADIRVTASLLQQACEALHHAHELVDEHGEPFGIVHRDVTPSNLYVGADGLLKLLDFGVAKTRGASTRTSTGVLKGKYAYMAPEQVSGAGIDRRADVFSLAVVAWEAIAGRPLFDRDSEFATLKAVVESEIPPLCSVRPAVPPALSAVVARALSRSPDERPATARELGRALGEAVGGILAHYDIAAFLAPRFAEELREQDELASAARARRAGDWPVAASVQDQFPPESLEPTETATAGWLLDVATAELGIDLAPRATIRLWQPVPFDEEQTELYAGELDDAIVRAAAPDPDAPTMAATPLARLAADAVRAEVRPRAEEPTVQHTPLGRGAPGAGVSPAAPARGSWPATVRGAGAEQSAPHWLPGPPESRPQAPRAAGLDVPWRLILAGGGLVILGAVLAVALMRLW